MNWSVRFNLIEHGTTYQGLGKYESFSTYFVLGEVEIQRRFCLGLCMATRGRWIDLLVKSGNRRDPNCEFRAKRRVWQNRARKSEVGRSKVGP